MRQTVRLGLVLVLLAAGLSFGVVPALAVSFDLTSDHCSGGCGPGGQGSDSFVFGTVVLLDNGSGGVGVTVTLTSGFAFAKTGAADMQAFKFNGVGVALADITVDSHVPSLAAATGAFNGDGTGDFSFGINCPTCGGGGSDKFTNPISFTVANATIADLT